MGNRFIFCQLLKLPDHRVKCKYYSLSSYHQILRSGRMQHHTFKQKIRNFDLDKRIKL